MNFILVEDHALVRDGISRIIEEKSNFKCLGTFESASEANLFLEGYFGKTEEDVICLVDLNLGKESGFDLISMCKEKFPKAYCVVYSMFTGAGIIDRAVQSGARGYVSKNASSKVLIDAMSRCKEDSFFLEDGLTKNFVVYSSLVQALTKREKELLHLFLERKDDYEIAETMGISVRAVENYFSRIFSKMNISGKNQLLEQYGSAIK